jgi:1-acyl-sn-glycerol-3-phosphate acyltransferase
MYTVVKIWIRLALLFFCRKIAWNDQRRTRSSGPLILACNHPNSFLDAIIVGSRFKKPVHFLARGDAFRRPFARKLLTALKLIPIYRLSEGREYLALNDTTFQRCQEVLQQKGILLIFSEGLCEHQWTLRPLKKGTARIAFNAWQSGLPASSAEVWPVSLSYNSFTRFGKRLAVHFGQPITADDISTPQQEGERTNQFNHILAQRLRQGMTTPDDPLLSPRSPSKITAALALILLSLPALTGWLLHIGYYRFIQKFTHKKTKGTVFYDSVLFGLLLLTYPLYWLVINLIGLAVLHRYGNAGTAGIMALLLLPLWGKVYVLWKDNLFRLKQPAISY